MTNRNPDPTSEVTTKVMKANKGWDTVRSRRSAECCVRWAIQVIV